MTKTTEELKQRMCSDLSRARRMTQDNCIPRMVLPIFEESLEKYLEALRQDLKTSHEATGDVAIQLQEAKTERDELRNKLQAFEFANQSAGELLRDALATVKRQREFIRTLYASRKARKSKPATRIQSSEENAAEAKCEAHAQRMTCGFGGLHKHYIGACPNCGSGTL